MRYVRSDKQAGAASKGAPKRTARNQTSSTARVRDHSFESNPFECSSEWYGSAYWASLEAVFVPHGAYAIALFVCEGPNYGIAMSLASRPAGRVADGERG